jgi:hypothetical protein
MYSNTLLLIPQKLKRTLALVGLTLLALAFAAQKANAEVVNLQGEWICALDPVKIGEKNHWEQTFPLKDTHRAILPGSLDTNGIGYPAEASHLHLGKPLQFEGLAWYQKNFFVPESFDGRYVELTLERTKVTKVWINGKLLGEGNWVYAPQHFDATELLVPGRENTITISVDNTMALVPVEGSHAYSPDTQTNWNGIIGKIRLTALNPNHIKAVRISSNITEKSFTLATELVSNSEEDLYLRVRTKLDNSDNWSDFGYTKTSQSEPVISTKVALGNNAKLWSDDDPNLYNVDIQLVQKEGNDYIVLDQKTLLAGLREFKATPDGFTINGHKTFLRGKHDACVFPLTGYPPMDVAGWMREFGIAKSYGINHYRFHTFTPPEAAFEAADRIGIYLQSELPMWWAFKETDEKQVTYLTNMGKAITDAYANHASFVMFSLGNELYQERSVLHKMVADIRAHDARPLYAQGSNNRLWDPNYAEGDDYWRSFRTGPYMEDGSTTARMSMSYLDSNGEGGLLNSRYPSTTVNFNKALERSPVPFLGFEVGQYQVFPNFDEITKYCGVLKPYNLEIYKERLKEAGMLDQAEDFFNASGALSVLCYRADIEAMLRTKRYAGFDLLDLQDYPGQGTALVGILDAFMDSKGLITPDNFRNFCDETVILLEQPKFCWTDAETYKATVKLSNFSKNDYSDRKIEWQLRDGRHVLKNGSIPINAAAYAGLTDANGSIEFSLEGMDVPARLDIDLFLNRTEITNSYPIWVYTASKDIIPPASVRVVDSLDEKALSDLKRGQKVILFPKAEAIYDHSTKNQFISEFWNWEMFTGFAKKDNKPDKFISAGTNGLLLNPHSKLVADFPTESHTNYQWWPIVTNSRALILDDLPGYRPTIQVIDSISRLHKLGIVCEFKVGEGKLLICTSRLPDHLEYPEVRQFYRSLLLYASLPDFDPDYEVTPEQLKAMGL